ncbi:MAG: hypothetical protein LBH56_02940, partial [Coriobacteriales bacterium]|nr:hypothetical protein [Coriobacteriales bacterium]
GFGTDGSIWGGEALIASLEDFERFAHLRPVPLPGGRGAIDNPARMAWAYLRLLGLTEHRGAAPLAATLGTDRVLLLDQMMAAHINTPTTSSMGRLFDAVSALAGIRATSSYEGQAAIELEAALYNTATGAPIVDPDPQAAAERYRFALGRVDTQDEGRGDEGNKWGQGAGAPEGAAAPNPLTPADTTAHPAAPGTEGALRCALEIDPTPLLTALLEDRADLIPIPILSLRFHDAVVRLIADLCEHARMLYGLSTVTLSGGVFMNRYLLSQSLPLLESEGFTVLLNRNLPANDGCISYGQAAIVAARLTRMAADGLLLGT